MKKNSSRYKLIVFSVFAITSMLHAQNKLNFGLTQKQPDNTLPVGVAKTEKAIPKTKHNPITLLYKNKQNDYILKNGWEMTDGNTVIANAQSIFNQNYQTKNWYNATVPGTVLTTLVQQGVYPDPYVGLNNLSIPDSLCRKDWWYRISFASPIESFDKLTWLQFDGINYKADIWLNGTCVGSINGAFSRGNFNVSKYLHKNEKNILAVHILPPPNPGIPHEQSATAGAGPNGGSLALDGPTFIASEGWDWMPGIRDRNIGIWQNVSLHFTRALTIQDPQVVTDLPLPDTSSANLIIKALVTNHSSVIKKCTVQGQIGSLNFSLPINLMPGEQKIVKLSPDNIPSLHLQHPKLWWPNGYGSQNLYDLKISVAEDQNIISDEKNIRFGVREFSYELMVNAPSKKEWRISYQPTNAIQGKPLFDNINRVKVAGGFTIPSIYTGVDEKHFETIPDSNNPYLVVNVNGQKIFCKGGNWGMDDAMKRVERERLEPAFRLHKEANYNMIRNWTGECTEEVFYELADEYGMLVWNDFWMSTEGYNVPPNNDQLTLDNITEVVKRFRNHASIAIWCPRNEGYAPVSMEYKISEILAIEDGTRHYNGNSREMNLRQSGAWRYINNPAEYFTKNVDGFTTEIGTFSIPTASTIQKFIKKEDQWPINDVWNYHDLHSEVSNQNLKGYLSAVDSLYGKVIGLDDFNKKVQLINYESHRAIFEAWNSKLWNNTSGVLLWMTHPAWPSMIWQTYSWDFETHGSYYGSKKACEPLHVQMNLHDQKVIVINSALESYQNLKVILKLYDLKGTAFYTKVQLVNIGTNQKVEAFTPDLSTVNLPSVYLARLEIENNKKEVLAENDYWKTNAATINYEAFNQLSKVTLVGKQISNQKGITVIEIQNNTTTPAIGIKLNLMDDKGAIVLPAYFSDGYFTLLPGEKKIVRVGYNDSSNKYQIKADGYNIKTALLF